MGAHRKEEGRNLAGLELNKVLLGTGRKQSRSNNNTEPHPSLLPSSAMTILNLYK
jgi:hypothetical protein